MQFDAEPPFVHAITGYGAQGFAIQGQWHRTSLLLGSDGTLLHWPVQSAKGELAAADLALVLDLLRARSGYYELLIVGTGTRQLFLKPSLLRPFAERALPLECMSTPAACRTYNIVASEGRKVLAALLRLDG